MPIDPRIVYRESIPPDLTETIGRGVIERYAIAFDKTEEQWLEEEQHDALAVVRRAEIETSLVGLRGMFDGIRVESVLNAARNSYHREVGYGLFVITQSMVEGPSSRVRDAVFRRILARQSQLSLNLLNDDAPPPDGAIWACFVHLPATDRRDTPSMIRVAFPDEAGWWSQYESWDLYDLVPSLRGYAVGPELATLREELRRQRRAG